jgi:phage shock protein PspC (stress-responsive transcriptional regulator)
MASSAKLYRVRKGAIFSGVCKGLEACGRGNALAYRIVFVLGGLYVIGIIVYVLMAASIPVATEEQLRELKEEDESGNSLDLIQSSGLDRLEAKLSKIESMKNQNLITSEEAEKLRSKVLGIS